MVVDSDEEFEIDAEMLSMGSDDIDDEELETIVNEVEKETMNNTQNYSMKGKSIQNQSKLDFQTPAPATRMRQASEAPGISRLNKFGFTGTKSKPIVTKRKTTVGPLKDRQLSRPFTPGQKKGAENKPKEMAEMTEQEIKDDLPYFLKPENKRDLNKVKMNDPGYDQTTLFVPHDYM